MSNLDSLKALPLIDRIIITVNTLGRYQQIHTEQGSVLGISRKLQDQAVFNKGKASAFRDATVFVTRLFEAEIREKVTKGETSDNDSVQGRDTGGRQADELGNDSGCNNQDIPDGNA